MSTYIILGIIIILGLWTTGSYLAIRNIEEPSYIVLEKKGNYEIRNYDPYIIAQTKVTGNYSEATGKGFSIVADYIFGNNTLKTSIAMTAPVLEQESEKIAMTAPVLEESSEKIVMTVPVVSTNENDERLISFVLPSKYTLETLPTPNNQAVEIIEVPSQKTVSIQFNWYVTEGRIEKKKAELLEWIQENNLEIDGNAKVAQYNPPLSMPLMKRNEIIIPIK